MMAELFRTGIDLVSVQDITDAIARHGARYLERVYTPQEIDYCLRRKVMGAQCFAARFAAKEAIIKVLRPVQGLPLTSIEVIKEPGGWCSVALHGAALDWSQQQSIQHISISLTHEPQFAAASALAVLSHPRNEAIHDTNG